ncbi:hypothetical protein [Stakelama marina]|uniref:Uncharacterized protein n=1 Tax=Stakelama marina TaxID=2826939 RepID=A0A8T4IB89_9SPHN|nr:hypothetical protein [Stakelama marina]MBR0551084.1 hypothetical protein [Stakelama marina]
MTDITNDAAPAPAPVRKGLPAWIWFALAGGIAVLGLAALAFLRNRRGWRKVLRSVTPDELDDGGQEASSVSEAEPEADAEPAYIPAAPSAEPLRVTIQPIRAGTAQGEGVVEFVISVDNPGGVDADDVVVAAWLRSAHQQQDAEVAQLLAAPPSPYLPKSRIAAGGSKRIQSRLTLPRNRMRVMQAGGRPYFIPMIIVDVRYKSGSARRAAAVVMVGRQQASSDKLGPIFLDQPTRMHDRVEARPHRVAIPA